MDATTVCEREGWAAAAAVDAEVAPAAWVVATGVETH